jgi:hypothetical protein
MELLKGICRLKANSLKIKKVVFGRPGVWYSYFEAPTLALGEPIATWSSHLPRLPG